MRCTQACWRARLDPRCIIPHDWRDVRLVAGHDNPNGLRHAKNETISLKVRTQSMNVLWAKHFWNFPTGTNKGLFCCILCWILLTANYMTKSNGNLVSLIMFCTTFVFQEQTHNVKLDSILFKKEQKSISTYSNTLAKNSGKLRWTLLIPVREAQLSMKPISVKRNPRLQILRHVYVFLYKATVKN